MPSIDSGGVSIHYELYGRRGSRAPLLLTHGFAASGRMWDANVDALAAEREVLTWDMRGHGRSAVPAGAESYGVEQSTGDMLALLDVLDAPRAVLCGMSLGGYLSLALHAFHPERVAGLIAVDTGPGFRSQASRARWNTTAEATAGALERDGLAALPASAEIGDHRSAAGLAHTARRVMAQHDARVIESLSRVAVPTLVLVGAQDTSFLAAADYMEAKIPGARKIVLQGAGHAANIDAAHEFNPVVNDFMEAI